jgi:signal transduction histidine kinase
MLMGVADGRVGWRDSVLPGVVGMTQVVWWLAPIGQGHPADLAELGLVLTAAALAVVALTWRRDAPEWALAATLAATLGGIGFGGEVVAGPLAAIIALYSLAVHRTAGAAALGAGATALVVGGTSIARGATPQEAIGGALVTAAGAAAVWAMGRSRRRRRTDRSAVATYRAASAEVPRLAASGERNRLATELHDVAAHRLTGIVVSAAAAARLTDPALAAEALSHAAEAGRQAVAELERLGTVDHRGGTLARLERLVAEHTGGRVEYRCTAGAAPEATLAVAYRVVRESLTNVMRYASDATTRILLEADETSLTVAIIDDGGTAEAPDVGTGHGLAGLREAVTAQGGTLSAGPQDAGWAVRVTLPLTTPGTDPVPSRRRNRLGAAALDWAGLVRLALTRPGTNTVPSRWRSWRGVAALDWALVVLGIGLPAGAGLVSGGAQSPGWLLLALLVLHAVSLRGRRGAPLWSLAAAQGALLLWLACIAAGRIGPESSQLLIWCWWVELSLAYAVGAYPVRTFHRPVRRATDWQRWRGWPVPLVVAGLGAFPLVTGETGSLGGGLRGSRPAVWGALTVMLAIPTMTAWAFGVVAGVRRRRRAADAAGERESLERAVAAAAAAEHRRIGAGLRRTAHRHAKAVVAAADDGRLDLVLAEARAGLGALRGLLTELRDTPADDLTDHVLAGPAEPQAFDDEPPPVVDGIAALAARRGGAAWYVGARRPLPAAVEVTAYRIAESLLTGGATVVVSYVDGGVLLSGPVPVSGRRLLAMADAAGGSLAATNDGAVRVWLPEVSPSRFG